MWKNPLPGVPAIESPFFEEIAADEGWDEQTRRVGRDLREHGFAVLDFPEPQIDALVERIVADLGPRYDWTTWRAHGRATGDGLRIQDAWRFNHDVARLACNPIILALLSRLYGREAFPFQTLNFAVGTQQASHSDRSHFSSVPEGYVCGVWLAFEDTDDSNGPLHYYPGSHRWPAYGNEHIGACSATSADPVAHYGQMLHLWQALATRHRVEKEIFRARKGQALIWSANLLHGGNPHLDAERTRWSQVTHYYFDGCSYYTPLTSDPVFGSIYFRDVQDIRTGASKPQVYSGNEIPRAIVERARQNVRAHAPAIPDLPVDFDPVLYLQANPDVAAAGVDPVQHWRMFGHREGRSLAPDGMEAPRSRLRHSLARLRARIRRMRTSVNRDP